MGSCQRRKFCWDFDSDRHLHGLEPEKKDMNLLPIDQKGRPLNQMKVLLFFKEM